MTIEQANPLVLRKPLRLWPGVAIVVIQWLVRFGLPLVAPDAELFGVGTQVISVIAGPAGLLAILVWWLFFSRARWSERLAAVAVMILAVVATQPLADRSIQNGMQGMMFPIYAVPPTLCLALVAWAAASRRLAGGPRWAAMIAAMLLGCGVWMLARTNGIFGGVADLEWRWTPTAEERLLTMVSPAAAAEEPPASIAGESGANGAEHPVAAATPRKPVAPETTVVVPVPAWPGFRGPDRNSIVRGVRINTDWSAAPPVELWRRPVGPGWSSFAVDGDRIYTQEQRGEDEIVACYSLTTGKPVWVHRDATRFWESNGGAGPRATPTLSGDRVYTFGATGILNALDARSGAVLWSRKRVIRIRRSNSRLGLRRVPPGRR